MRGDDNQCYKLTTKLSLLLCLPETEVAEVPCEEEVHGDRGDRGDHGVREDREDPQDPSYGAVHGVRVPSCQVVEAPLEVPTAEQEYSEESAFYPAALGSGNEGEMLENCQPRGIKTFFYLDAFHGHT